MAERQVARNRKAYYDYEILEELEAGLVLLGTEVKSLRDNRATLKESFARIADGELWLENCHIAPYSHGNLSNHEPRRSRKLLLHRRQIQSLAGKVAQKGLTIVPLSLYFKNGRVKVKVGLAKGKRRYDKRESKRRKAIDREVQSALKRRLQ